MTGPAWPSPRSAWRLVLILAIAQAVSAVDRNVLNVLIEPIKKDLSLSDTEMGLLLGFGFALVYTTAGVVVGRLADLYMRVRIIALGMVFWSVATSSCAMAQNYAGLLMSRIGVAAGESALNPSGFSLISDSFPPHRRAKPLGFFIMGQTVGAALAILGGGVLIQYLTAHAVHFSLPTGAVLKPWQLAFLCAGAPGLLVALLVLSLKEPARQELHLAQAQGGGDRAATLGEVARFFWANGRTYIPICLGFGLILMWEIGRSVWMPSYLIRVHHWSPGQVGVRLATLTLFLTAGGAAASGWVSDYLMRRGRMDASLRAARYAALIMLPFAIAAPLASGALSIALFAPLMLLGAFPFALGPAAIALITPNRMRAQITAVYLFVINVLGTGLGPTLVGLFSDRVFEGPEAVRHALPLLGLCALPAAILFLTLAMRDARARGVAEPAMAGGQA